jgi:tetratricopeptide (TPR) repeat protein
MQAPTMGPPGPGPQAGTQLAELENRIRENPENHEFVLQVANFAHDNGYFDKAIIYYDEYLGHHPDDVNAIVDKGICYHELQRSDEAIGIMKGALEIQPDHLQANFNLGIVNLQTGNIEESNRWFSKVVAIAPNSDIGKRAQELLAPHSNLPAR